MQTTTMDALSELWSDGGLLQLNASPFGTRGEDGLAQLFEIGRSAVRILRHHCEHKSPDGRACFVGQLPGWIEGAKLRDFMHRVELQHPIRPEAPFEGTARIAGAAWVASRELGDHADDGIAKLCFAPNTANLPLHTHEQSERFIFCLQGRGTFHYCRTSLDEFDGTGTQEVPIRTGSFVLFSRKVLHTFSSCRPGMVLISFQAPSLPFDDPKQYTLPPCIWTPDTALLQTALALRNRRRLTPQVVATEAPLGGGAIG